MLFLEALGLSALSFWGSYILSTRKVIKANDGDTFKFRNRFAWNGYESVRIFGLNCPEKGEYHWKESGDFLRFLIQGNRVFLTKLDEDKYRRSVCKVYRLGFDVAAVMIFFGAGKEYRLDLPKGEPQPYTNGKYKKYEFFARLFKWGVWRNGE